MTKPLTLHAHEVRRLQAAGGVTLWRPVKPQPEPKHKDLFCEKHELVDIRREQDVPWVKVATAHEWVIYYGHIFIHIGHCPHGAPGQQRWCRETWAALWPGEYPVPPQECNIEYRADTSDPLPGQWPWDERDSDECPHWKSPVTMPKWASRYTVTVQAVTVKRVGELTDAEICEFLEAPATWPGPGIEPYPRQLNRAMQIGWDARYGKLYPYPDAWAWGISVALAAQPEPQPDKFRGQGGAATRLGWPP